ncbi:E3 ubiquitin-protein ligase TTC3-like [Urocitellus parryii]
MRRRSSGTRARRRAAPPRSEGEGAARGVQPPHRGAHERGRLAPTGLCAMDNFTDGDFTVADYALLQDSPFEDDCVFAPEYKTDDYVRVTQLYCDGVGMKYKDYAQSEKHLEFDICNIRCSKPLSVLQDYCDAIKIYIFWPLLFQHQYSSVISRLHPCVETISRASEMSLKKLQYLELM